MAARDRHVPPEQYPLAERRPAGPCTPPPPPPQLSFAAQTAPGDVTREVALTAIQKNKAKGNKESVWCEMWVLQGLDHPNIVGRISPPPFSP